MKLLYTLNESQQKTQALRAEETVVCLETKERILRYLEKKSVERRSMLWKLREMSI